MRTLRAVQMLWFAPLLVSVVLAAQHPVRNVQVTLRGKRYDIADDVTTVAELQERVKEASGLSSLDSQSILFGGKRLSQNDILSDVGVSDGDQLSMVPSTKSKKKSSSSSSSSSGSKKTVATSADTTAVPSTVSDAASAMKDYLRQAGVDPNNLDDMLKGLGGGNDGSKDTASMPSIAESMEMMQNMVSSPLFQEYMSDPEKLEQSRQMILNNPMLKSMMTSMPGMEELLNDQNAWKDAMQAAANLYKSMDKDDLIKAMMSGSAGAGMDGSGFENLFHDTLDLSPSAKAALDELDEDD